jgi:hypothetical protein
MERSVSILRRSLRFWPVAAIVILLGWGGTGVFVYLKPSYYKSEALVRWRGNGPLKIEELSFTRATLEKVIRETGLYTSIIEERGYVEAVDELRRHLALTPRDASSFALSFEGTDPELAQRVATRLVETLTGETVKPHVEPAAPPKPAVSEEERVRAESDLKLKEAALAAFVTQHPEFAQKAQAPAPAKPPLAKAPARVDGQIAMLEREAARIRERMGTPAPKKKPREDAPDPKLVADKRAAETELAVAQAEYNDKLARFTEQHPDVLAAKARVVVAKERLARAQEALAGVRVQEPLSGAGEPPKSPPAEESETGDDEGIIDRATLERELKKIQGEIAVLRARRAREEVPPPVATPPAVPAATVLALDGEWQRLNREVDDARRKKQLIQDKLAITTAVPAATSPMVIVDPPYLPTHAAKLGHLPLIGVGCGATFVLAMLMILCLALIDDRVYDRSDVEKLRLATVLVVVPRGGGGAGG